MSYQLVVTIFATLMYGGLTFLVYFSKPFSEIKRSFALYLLSMFVWSLIASFVYFDFDFIDLIFRGMVVAAIFSMLAIYNFVQTFFGASKLWSAYVYIYGIVAGGISFFTSIIATGVYLENNLLHYELVPWSVLIIGPGYFLMFFSLYEIYQGFRATSNITQKNRFRYLIIALTIISLSSVVNFTELGKYPIDVAANGLAALLITYSILKHQLIEIQLVFRAGLLYTVLTAIVGAINYLVINVLINTFDFIPVDNLLSVSLLIALLTSAILSPLRDRIQEWIDKIFYRTKYDGNEMLERLSRATASILDLNRITEMILNEIQDTMLIKNSAIFIRREGSEYFELIGTKGYKKQPDVKFRLDNPIVIWIGIKKETLHSTDLSAEPRFKSMWNREIEDLEKLNGNLYIPIVVMGNMVGILVIGPKKSAQPISNYDHSVLSTLSNQIAIAIENAKLYEELENAFVETITTLANAIDLRDSYTSDHSKIIATLARDTAKQMKLPTKEVEHIFWAGLLHDVGKIGIPDSILLKPSKLTVEEFEIMKGHTNIGAELAEKIKKLEEVAPLIRSSHERIDGTGYPNGLMGDEIPLGARIISVVDAYSAMIDERIYAKPKTTDEAIAELKRCAGSHFDSDIVKVFVEQILK